jgi:RNA polymerase sigma factor (sigma-70 family)
VNLPDFRAWQKARGPAKARLLAKMSADNEPLVEKFAMGFLKSTQYATDPVRDDVFQAARIGLLTAITKWDPELGAFSTLAFFEMRNEMQLVMRHVTPVSRPRDADLDKCKQDAIAVFQTKHGRAPTPEEVGVRPAAIVRMQKARASFTSLAVAQNEPAETPEDSPEDIIDRKRDMASLQAYVRGLSPAERKEFWTGKREDLTAEAKEYVERRRNIRAV